MTVSDVNEIWDVLHDSWSSLEAALDGACVIDGCIGVNKLQLTYIRDGIGNAMHMLEGLKIK